MYSVLKNKQKKKEAEVEKWALTEEEILRWLKRFKYDPEFRNKNGTRAVPIATFTDFAGLSRPTITHFMLGYRGLGLGARIRLTQAISAVAAGLRWHRSGRHDYVMNDPERFNKFPLYEKMHSGDAA